MSKITYTATARWNGFIMEVHFDGNYRAGSNTYTKNGTMCTPQDDFLNASYLWSDTEYRHQMTFQEFIDKTLGYL
jgi:chitodextrinase